MGREPGSRAGTDKLPLHSTSAPLGSCAGRRAGAGAPCKGAPRSDVRRRGAAAPQPQAASACMGGCGRNAQWLKSLGQEALGEQRWVYLVTVSRVLPDTAGPRDLWGAQSLTRDAVAHFEAVVRDPAWSPGMVREVNP